MEKHRVYMNRVIAHKETMICGVDVVCKGRIQQANDRSNRKEMYELAGYNDLSILLSINATTQKQLISN